MAVMDHIYIFKQEAVVRQEVCQPCLWAEEMNESKEEEESGIKSSQENVPEITFSQIFAFSSHATSTV